MPCCPKCGSGTDAGDTFCRKCGTALSAAATPTAEAPTAASAAAEAAADIESFRENEPKLRAVAIAVALVLVVPLLLMFALGKGCGRVEGTLVSSGKPLGDFTLTPAQCRSGDHMNFYGVILVGTGPTDGGLLVATEPAHGTYLKLEVPGSCKPPDYEVCTEVMIKREQCSHWDVDVSGSLVIVNERRVMHGHARAECAFPEGGMVKVDLDFERCL